MKKKHCLFFVFASLLVLASCSEEQEEPDLTLHRTGIQATSVGMSYTLTFSCNMPWTAKSDVSWCKIDPTQGAGGAESEMLKTITVHIESNPTFEERKAIITIQVASLQKEIVIVQAAAIPSFYSTTPMFVRLEGKKNTYAISVTSNLPWTVTVDDATEKDWCTVTPSSGSGDGTITVSVTDNHGYARRHAFISIIGNDTQLKFTILQDGNEVYSDPSLPVTINGITWASRNVNDFCTFVDSPTEIGKYYKFNSTIGYSYIGGYLEVEGSNKYIVGGNVDPVFDSEYTIENSDWSLLNNPSPTGWRLPTDEELENLRASGYRWVDEPAGAWCGPDAQTATFTNPGSAIFLPAGGTILYDRIRYAGQGLYWTKTQVWIGGVADSGRILLFYGGSSSNVRSTFIGKHWALPIRCVKE